MRDEMRRVLAALAVGLLLIAGVAAADDDDDDDDLVKDKGRHCSATAKAAYKACVNDARADRLVTLGNCFNVSDGVAREECISESEAALAEAKQLCGDQLDARREVCTLLGEGRYDPDFDPALFEEDFSNLASSNVYMPLAIGNRWEFGGDETIVIEVLDRTKRIEGVPCIVVNDRVTVDGRVVEDTDDWFAQAQNGDVYYCGEEVKDYESFDEDVPVVPELTAIDGSFKAGREGAKPGIVFLGSPVVGAVYRQEFDLNNAEDLAEVLTATYSFGADAELDELVPQGLADLLCAGDCVVTKEFSPLAPGGFERKYYAPGIGQFFSVNPGSGEFVQLVSCNFDARCGMLPTP